MNSTTSDNTKKTIVIVDDEKSFCDLVSFFLNKAGFQVKCFTDAQEALQNITNINTDLILLDIDMPKINGFNFIAYLKKDLNEKCPPILFLTNLTYDNSGNLIDDEYAKSMVTLGVIHKTADIEVIINKIKSIFQNN
ncbi:MAG: hypothetical protein KatS3mg097_598 [Candidatus Parcubacteria bacterium]|nr:MAG: hypothetical protein KatS3mg097_598 [Candidatus Parcubacteria bacterium]